MHKGAGCAPAFVPCTYGSQVFTRGLSLHKALRLARGGLCVHEGLVSCTRGLGPCTRMWGFSTSPAFAQVSVGLTRGPSALHKRVDSHKGPGALHEDLNPCTRALGGCARGLGPCTRIPGLARGFEVRVKALHKDLKHCTGVQALFARGSGPCTRIGCARGAGV